MTITGKCYCGAVQVEFSEPPQSQLYCHCDSCRSWTGQQVMNGAVFASEAVRFVSGEDSIRRFRKSESRSLERLSCAQCGASIGVCVPALKFYDICVGLLEDFKFEPTIHVNYQDRVVSMPDGLPKFRDLPKSTGGTGELIRD